MGLAETNGEEFLDVKQILEKFLSQEDRAKTQKVTWGMMKDHPYIGMF